VPDWPEDKGPDWYPRRTGLLGDWGYGVDCSDAMSRQRDNSCVVTVSILYISCCTSGSLISNFTGYLPFPGSANHGMGSRAFVGWRVHRALRTA